MHIYRKSLLDGASAARGTAVVIDVFRAFTCGSILLDYGVSSLLLEEDPARVLRLKEKHGYIALGERGGIMVEGFDLGNSPTEIVARGRDFFQGRTVVMRTSAGVRGIFAAMKHCQHVYAGSYTTAPALAALLKKENPAEVHLVAMGWNGKDPAPEDEHCAAFIHHLLDPGSPYSHLSALREILSHESAQKFLRGNKPHFPPTDVPYCLGVGLFGMAMKVSSTPEGLELCPVLVKLEW
ncbi:MAG TPA: 2-phosphosulfolactate phosphatase [archaeon]|nr:2-phosphosulfolactate phosphatase [archaeon]